MSPRRTQQMALGGALCSLLGLLIAVITAPSENGFPDAAMALLVPTFGLLVWAIRAGVQVLTAAGRGFWLVLLVLGTIAWAYLWSAPVADLPGTLALPVSLGTILVLIGMLQFWRIIRERETPWQQLAADPAGRRAAQVRAVLLPLTTGIGLLTLGQVLKHQLGGSSSGVPVLLPSTLGLPALILLAGSCALVLVLIARLFQRHEAQQEVQVAAHLHDSVLQDLAVIRRQADDPDAVRATARSAERGLRDWLAGRDAESETALKPLLTQVCRQVEDEHPGSTIEIVVAGDARVDARTRAIVDATREALRNAVRHGGGAARCFAEVDDEASITVYVRDTGRGFDPTAVPPERRGVRDAVVGRMESVNGSAKIETSDEGTEATLHLPPPESGQ